MSTPRINFELMTKYSAMNTPVRLVGEVKTTPGEPQAGQVLVTASDGKDVVVELSGSGGQDIFKLGHYVEIVGTVKSEGVITELTSNSFGSKFNMEHYNTLVTIANDQKHSKLFLAA